jgi:hypothetical protein
MPSLGAADPLSPWQTPGCHGSYLVVSGNVSSETNPSFLTRSGHLGERRVVSAAATTWPTVAIALTLGRGMAPRYAIA